MNMLSDLIRIANECDTRGLFEIASEIDEIIIAKMKGKPLSMLKPTPKRVFEKGVDSLPGTGGGKPWIKHKKKKKSKRTATIDELTRIADECDTRGLFEIANEIDAAMIDSSMSRFAGKANLIERLLKRLGLFATHEWEPMAETAEKIAPRSLERLERMIERSPKKPFTPWEGPFPAKDMTGHVRTPPAPSNPRLPSEQYLKDLGGKVYEPSRNPRLPSEKYLDDIRQSNNSNRLIRMAQEEFEMSPEDLARMQRAEIEAEEGSGSHISGFHHGGEEDRDIEGLESFEPAWDRAEPDRHQHGRDFPNIDDPTNQDFVGQEELEAASDILEKLLRQLPQEEPGEPKGPPPPRIAANMGDLSRIRTGSKRSNLSETQREQIMRRMS